MHTLVVGIYNPNFFWNYSAYWDRKNRHFTQQHHTYTMSYYYFICRSKAYHSLCFYVVKCIETLNKVDLILSNEAGRALIVQNHRKLTTRCSAVFIWNNRRAIIVNCTIRGPYNSRGTLCFSNDGFWGINEYMSRERTSWGSTLK